MGVKVKDHWLSPEVSGGEKMKESSILALMVKLW